MKNELYVLLVFAMGEQLDIVEDDIVDNDDDVDEVVIAFVATTNIDVVLHSVV